MMLSAHTSPQPKRDLDRFNRLCTDDREECLYTLQWLACFTSELPLSMLSSGPHLIRGSLGPSESATQMATLIVSAVFAGLTD